MLGIMPHEQTQNLVLNTLPALLCGGGFGGLPNDAWFYYSVSIAMGTTYLKTAIEDDDAGARTLTFTRTILGVLNMVIASRTHCVNYLYGAIEILTALLFWKTLDHPSKKKRA